ncbi:calmodulin [Novymonas esmeraldas]|uniref:Calmodulin n=1 Tax=Novymonas esmeraldas TaxID=1808958 RepID=A0AAW0EN87_9TRYP
MENLSEKELKELKEIFDLVDSDHTGVISLHELRKLMTALHLQPTEQELDDVVEETRRPPSISLGSGGIGVSATLVSAPLPSSSAVGGVRSGSVGSGSISSSATVSTSAAAVGGHAKVDASTPGVNNNSTTSAAAAAAAAVAAPRRTVTFPQFAAMMARRVQSEYTAEQLRNAFQLFESPDMPEGFVSTSVLAHALATYGSQKLEKDEIDRLVAAIDPAKTGRVNYYEFVDIVTG